MYHYKLINTLNHCDIPLDSGRRSDFDGYHSSGIAYMQGLKAKINEPLSDLYHIIVYESDSYAPIQPRIDELPEPDNAQAQWEEHLYNLYSI